MGGVDERGAQVEPAGGAQLGQQPLVQLLPDPDGLPVPQSPPAGHPRAAEHRWSIPPGHPGPQDEHDPGQRGSVVHRPATWIAEPSWPGRDQRCQPPPQLVSEHVVQHPTTPTAQRSSGVRPTRARCETRSKWRALPHDLPPWQTCWRWWARLHVAGEGRPSVWDEIVAALRGVDRVGTGRAQEPTAAIVDSPSAKSSEGGQGQSFDTNNRVNGRTRHAFVDVEGNLLLVGLTGAGTSDTAAAKDLLAAVVNTDPSLRVSWCDQGYQASFVEAAKELGLEVIVVGRQPGTRGFTVLPRRWVVERFFAWISRARRLAGDFARSVWSACGMVQVGLRPDAAASAHLGSGGGLTCS